MSTSLATRPRRLAPHLPSRACLRRVTLHICEKTAASLTFAILPRCVPGQAEEGREENDRGGHRSISEPHLISAMPLLG